MIDDSEFESWFDYQRGTEIQMEQELENESYLHDLDEEELLVN